MPDQLPKARSNYDVIVDGLIRRFGNSPDTIQEYIANIPRLIEQFGTNGTMQTDPDFFAAIMRLSRDEAAPAARAGNVIAPAWPARRPAR